MAMMRKFRQWRLCRDGTITVETALAATVLSAMLIATIDFGLAFTRKMEVSNAVRSGAQFGLVLRPTLNSGQLPSNDQQNIRDAVVESAGFLDSDPGNKLDVSVFCQCPDGTAVACTTSGGSLPCSDRQTFLQVELTQPYSMLFRYPGISKDVSFTESSVVRLN